MFEVNNGIAKIDGTNGKYNSNDITNPSVRYGRNAVSNYYSYLEQPIVNDSHEIPPILDFGFSPNAADNNIKKLEKYTEENDKYLNSLPPLEYEYRYMPNLIKKGEIDKNALLGAAYEELGRRNDVSVEDMEKTFGMNEEFTVKPIDINNDGKIDTAEYGATILAADMYSKSDTEDTSNIDGTVSTKGMNKILEYTHKSNAEAAANLYSNLYNKYNLGESLKDFNPNS